MFSLLAGFFKWLFSKTEVHILILGLDHAGKTTLLEQMKGVFQRIPGIPLERIPPTVGLNIGRMDINNCKVIFWDLGGQSRLRTIWDNYYTEAHGLMFVLDAANPERFQEAKDAFDSLLLHPDLTGIPVLLCANKQDLHNARTAEEINNFFQLNKLPGLQSNGTQVNNQAMLIRRNRQIKLQAISALTCSGVEEGIRWLVDSAVNNPEIIRARTTGP